MKFFLTALLRAFRKEMGRSPNPGEMDMLKKKAKEMEQSEKIIPFPQGGKDKIDPFKERPKEGEFSMTVLDDAGNPVETKSTTPEGIMDFLMGKEKKITRDADELKPKMTETEAEMILRMNRQNKEAVERLKKKKDLGERLKDLPDDIPDMAEGGLIKEAEKYATQKESEFLKSVDIDNIPRTGNLQREQERAYENAYREYMEKNKKAEGGIIGLAEGGPSDPGRRRFIKILGGLASIPVLGRFIKPVTEVAPVVAEGVKTVPSYFFKLVDKIKTLGDDAPGITTTEREIGKKYKDYELVEDLSSGDIVVKKNKEGGAMFGDEYETGIMQEEVMAYRPRKKTPEGELPEDYQEITARPSMPDGSMDDFDDGLDSLDDILEEVGEKRAKQAGGGIAYLLGE